MSTKRKVIFVNDEIYHVFNRSVANQEILVIKRSIDRFLDLLSFYRFDQKIRYSFFNRASPAERENYLAKLYKQKPLVNIHAYALMPNHFHLLLGQKQEKGVERFVSNIQNSFAKYFNIRSKRNGPLFQRPFKATHISSDKEFLHVSRYIHLNPVTSYIFEFDNLSSDPITSFPSYLKPTKSFVNTNLLIEIAGSVKHYENFVKNQIEYQRKLNKIKHLIIE